MSSDSERQFATVLPPSQSNTAGVGITFLAATTTAANAVVPSPLLHRYVDIFAKGDEIWVAFGPAGSPNVDKTKTGGSSFAAGTSNANGFPLANGTKIRVRLDRDHAQISWQANASNSTLIIYPSSQPVGRASGS